MKKTFHLVSLGCPKNLVDSDSMAQLLVQDGWRPVEQPKQAEVLIVNTCGFIAPARAESYQVLNDLAAKKRPGQWLIAAGCLTQRYGSEVASRVKGVDGVIGTRRWMDILEVVQGLRGRDAPEPLYHLPEVPSIGMDEGGALRASRQGNSAYLKIADGCRRPCAFCAIPLIKGSLVSRPLEAILADGRALQEAGVQEIILLAQDTTDYGADLGMKDGLTHLLERLLPQIPNVPWLRILYTYPGAVSDAFIDFMASHPQVLPYLDIPLQHAHPDVLRRMLRPANPDWVVRTIEKMRRAIPHLALRTTFIVGYPGETEVEFQALLDFMSEMRFDKVGAFQYSFEEGIPAASLGDPIPSAVKQERWNRLMEHQQSISLEKNLALVGQQLQVLVEGEGEVEGSRQPILVGRSYRDAPEIDGLVLVENALPGVLGMIDVRVTGALAYDLVATPINKKSRSKPGAMP